MSDYNKKLEEARLKAREEQRLMQENLKREIHFLSNEYANLLNSQKKSAKDYITPEFAIVLAEQYLREVKMNMPDALRMAIQKEKERLGIFKKPEMVELPQKKAGIPLQNIFDRAKLSQEIYRLWTNLGKFKEHFSNSGGDTNSDLYKQQFNEQVVLFETVRTRLDENGGPLNKEEMEIAEKQGFNPETLSQTSIPKRLTRGGRKGKAMPSDLDTSQQIAKQSYNLTDPQKDINGWILQFWSPNLKIYTKENIGILGVRGTKTMEDVSVWPTVTLNTLGNTNLYKRIEKEFMDFKNEHPEITEYYAVGHSLGGALIDVMLRKGIVKEAVSYNPAIQYNDINGGLPNRRIYYGDDPMYRLMGWWDRKAEHRDTDIFSKFLTSIIGNPVSNMLSAHKLSNFTGGRRCRKCGLMK